MDERPKQGNTIGGHATARHKDHIRYAARHALPTATVLSSAPFTGIDDWPARFVRVAMRDAEKLRHRAKQLLLLAQKARDDTEAGDAGESRLMVRNERAGHPSTRLAAVIY
jgi:hypothetical protein